MGSVILMMLQVGNQLDEEEKIPPQIIAVEKHTHQPISFVAINTQKQKMIDLHEIIIVAGQTADEKTLLRLEQAQKYAET